MNMKRILSLALMALLLCLPVWAMAEIVASGTNGENVNWSLDGEGTLTISGRGDMAGDGSGHWEDNTAISVLNIKKVVIGDGITSIGEAQFRFHENLQSVVIGKDVVSIGKYAFDECYALESINIPDGVTSIGECCFYGCESLKSITLPSTLTGIENNTFNDSGLENIVIPEGVKTIDYNAFYGCDSLVNVTIPESVTSISEKKWNEAFAECTNLKTVKVPCSWHENPLYDFGDSVTLDYSGEWSEWAVVKPATSTEEGLEQRTCTCGHVETREIPMLPALPQTGDDSNVILWSALAIASVIGMTILAYKRKEA